MSNLQDDTPSGKGNACAGPGPTPIETLYNGVRFRSRLEARWALFMDTIGVRWLYEHEGYELPSGRYLPDFWLPEIRGGCFVEIKPERPPRSEMMRYRDLVLSARHTLFLFFCAPGQEVDWSWEHRDEEIDQELNGAPAIGFLWESSNFDLEAIEESVRFDAPFLWASCRACGRIGIAWEGREDRVCGSSCPGRIGAPPTRTDFTAAAKRANAHRFWEGGK